MASNVGLASLRNPRIVRVAAITVAAVVLLQFALQFRFVCDDAFITLRYARNLATLGAPVYNPGERVEGYTNFLWMVLVAGGVKLGLSPVAMVKILGGLSGVLTLVAAWLLWERVEPKRPGGGIFVVLALALSAPLAAWTLGGLETPLFAGLTTLGFALAADVAGGANWKRAGITGVVLALATLTRPEGALMFGIAGLVVLVSRGRTRVGWGAILTMALAWFAIVGPFVAWRWNYYGYPLPNTFYLKVSGQPEALRRRGFGYLAFAAMELGPWLLALIALALFVPNRRAAEEDETNARTRRGAVLWMGRLLLPPFVFYIASVGGDFLDLYRFFVPLLPMAFVLLAAAGFSIVARLPKTRVPMQGLAVVGLGVLVAHGITESRAASRSLQIDEPQRILRSIEPLGWTRLYALRWAAIGRWIGRHAHAGEWMAAGAAGATPYYAGINNLDTLGLCDTFVSHHGESMGDRPGHQRFAPLSYVLSKNPVFVLIGDRLITDDPANLPRDPYWEAHGYRWIEVRLDARDGAPAEFYHQLIVRNDRIETLRGDPDVRIAGVPSVE